ncbi:MAG: chemotaxis protein CheB [Caldilineaceae bacterium]
MTEQMSTNEITAEGTDVHAATPPTFPVIGLVGAAGSRQALESFFRNLPDDSGMAFVVVTRLTAKHNQQLAAAIAARTDMPVTIAADGAAVQADHVYIAPPGVQLTLEQGAFACKTLTGMAAQDRWIPFWLPWRPIRVIMPSLCCFPARGKMALPGYNRSKPTAA